MPITNRMPNGQVLRNLLYGLAVERATAALPATTQAAIFTVTGGRVAVLGIIGEVTTIIQAQANAVKIRTNPTVGTDVDLCTTLDTNAKEAGTLFGITGTFGDAMVGANAGASVLCDLPVVVPVGTIDLVAAATNTGSVKWAILYVPIDDGATVTAA